MDIDYENDVVPVVDAVSRGLTFTVDTLQRICIISADFLLIIFAGIAISRDWGKQCDQDMQLYAGMCIALCIVDSVIELLRCSSESMLDRLQEDFKNTQKGAGNTGEGLLGGGGGDNVAVVGAPADSAAGREPVLHHREPALGRGMRRERDSARRRTAEFQNWSIIFSLIVSVMFSFLSSRDEECNEMVPNIYQYIRSFTYTFALRMGFVLLLYCCRTVKDYEEVAAHAAAFRAEAQGEQMQNM